MASEHMVRELESVHLADGRRLEALADVRQLILSLPPADRAQDRCQRAATGARPSQHMGVFATHGEALFRMLGLIPVARERRLHGAAFPHS